MGLKDVAFRLFGLAALIEIVALVTAVQGYYRSMLLFYAIGAAALVALGALGLYTFEAWRHPTSHRPETTQ